MADPVGSPVGPYGPGPLETTGGGASRPQEPRLPDGGSFMDMLKNSIYEVSDLQARSNNMIEKYATGEVKSLHEVMVASEESSIAFNLLLQIRTQLLRAWNELKRMPV